MENTHGTTDAAEIEAQAPGVQAQAQNGMELIEVPHAVYELAERVRGEERALPFYREALRVGLQRAVDKRIREIDQFFLKASKRPGLKTEDIESMLGVRTRALKELEGLKAEVAQL